MTREEVVELMSSSKTEREWNENADTVKALNDGQYPGFWYAAILLSGVAHETRKKWGW